MSNLSDRFLIFAVEVIKRGKVLNKSFEGRHIYGQLFLLQLHQGLTMKNHYSGSN